MSCYDVFLVTFSRHECSTTVGALQSIPGVPSHMIHVACFDIEAFITLLAVVLILALMFVHVVYVAITRAELFLTDMALEEHLSGRITVDVGWYSIRLWGLPSLFKQSSLEQKHLMLASFSIC